MSSDIDLDDLLDEVLNDSAPKQSDDMLDSVMDELLPVAPASKLPENLKYPELSSLDTDTRNEWTKTIEVDEAVMKLKSTKPLSNAYQGKDTNIKSESLQEVLSFLLKEESLDPSCIATICSDKNVMDLFAKELGKRIKGIIRLSDKDLADSRFCALRALLSC